MNSLLQVADERRELLNQAISAAAAATKAADEPKVANAGKVVNAGEVVNAGKVADEAAKVVGEDGGKVGWKASVTIPEAPEVLALSHLISTHHEFSASF